MADESLRIKDFSKLLENQIKEDGTHIPSREERLSRKRETKRVLYHKKKNKMSSNSNGGNGNDKRPAAKRPAATLEKFRQMSQSHMEEDTDMDEQNKILTNALAAHAQEVANQHEHKRRKQHEDRQFYMMITGVAVQGTTSTAPEVVPTVYDTPMRPAVRAVSPADFVGTPHRNEIKQQNRNGNRAPIAFDLGIATAIPEGSEFVPPLFEYKVAISRHDGKGDGTVEFFHSSFSTAERVHGFVQVLDCAVALKGGMVVPVKFLKENRPSMMGRLYGASATLTIDDLDQPLEVSEPISAISSYGDLLLAKGLSQFHLWQYVANTGTFKGPLSFAMDADSAHGLVDGAIVGFDVDLTENAHAVLRKALIVSNDGLSVQPQTADRSVYLPKNRMAATFCAALGETYILATKTVGRKPNKQPFPHMFVEKNGNIEKVYGFNDGVVVEIAGNANDLFARDIHGSVWFKRDDKWDDFKTKDEKPLDVSAIASCDDCCVAVKDSTVFFLFSGQDNKCKIIQRDLQADIGISNVSYFDGSLGSISGFLGGSK